MHCYLLEQAEVAGLIDVDVIYNGGGNPIYLHSTAGEARSRDCGFLQGEGDRILSPVAKCGTPRHDQVLGMLGNLRMVPPRIVALPIFRAKLIEGISLGRMGLGTRRYWQAVRRPGAQDQAGPPGSSYGQRWMYMSRHRGMLVKLASTCRTSDVTSFPSPRRIDCSTWGSVCRLWKR